MNSWSSFKDDKIIMEAWRSHLDEDVDAKRLAEDLDKELERIDELFGFGKSREDKWKAIAAGEDEEDAAEPADAAKPDGEKEEKRGFFGKMADYAKGVKDISGFFGKGAGTLLGGEETFDIKKRKELKDNAQKELNKWLSNLNYPPLSAINNKLFSAQFPNNDKSEFNQQLQMVNQAYDTIVSDHEEGKIDAPRANLIIAVMRGMLIYYQDFAIADRYMYIKEQEDEAEEEEEKAGAAQGAVSKNVAAAYSKKLPLGLAAAGTAAMGAGFLANSAWFQDWLLSLRDMTETIEVDEIVKNATKTMDLGEVKPGEGVIKVIRRLVPGKEDFARGTGSNLGFLKDPKNKMVYNLLKAAMGDQPGTDVGAFENLVNSDADAFTTFVSGPMSGRGGTLFAINKGKFQGTFNNIIRKQIQRVKKQPANTTKNWFISNAAKFLGPVLQALGLGALAGAGVSAAMRAKGKRSSRMAQLKTLVDTMVDVTAKDAKTPPQDATKSKGPAPVQHSQGRPALDSDAQAAQQARASASNAAAKPQAAAADDKKAAKKCNPGYGVNSQGVCVPFGTPDPGSPGGKVAPGGTASDQAAEKPAKKCNPGYGLNSSGACVPWGTPDTKMPGGKVQPGAGVNESTDRWQKLAGIIKG